GGGRGGRGIDVISDHRHGVGDNARRRRDRFADGGVGIVSRRRGRRRGFRRRRRGRILRYFFRVDNVLLFSGALHVQIDRDRDDHVRDVGQQLPHLGDLHLLALLLARQQVLGGQLLAGRTGAAGIVGG